MKIKYFFLVVVFAIIIWVVDIPLWFHFSGANSKYWTEFRRFDQYGLHFTGGVRQVSYDFELRNGYFKEDRQTCDTIILRRGKGFTTFGGTMNSINGSWHPRKVIYHSKDTIKFIAKCYSEKKFVKTDSGIVYNMYNNEPPGFVLDTFYWINVKPPKVILNQWELPRNEDELDISL